MRIYLNKLIINIFIESFRLFFLIILLKYYLLFFYYNNGVNLFYIYSSFLLKIKILFFKYFFTINIIVKIFIDITTHINIIIFFFLESYSY